MSCLSWNPVCRKTWGEWQKGQAGPSQTMVIQTSWLSHYSQSDNWNCCDKSRLEQSKVDCLSVALCVPAFDGHCAFRLLQRTTTAEATLLAISMSTACLFGRCHQKSHMSVQAYMYVHTVRMDRDTRVPFSIWRNNSYIAFIYYYYYTILLLLSLVKRNGRKTKLPPIQQR